MIDWQKWIKGALEFSGMKQNALAAAIERELGVNFDKSKINKVVAGKRSLSTDESMAIFRITGFPLPLDGLPKKHLAAVEIAPVVGVVSAGYWFENDMELNQETEPGIPCVPGKYVGLKQFAYRVQGQSMNADRIFDGDFVICVPYWEARSKLTGGDTVIVLRTRGQLKELSCKRLVQALAGFELWPKSTDQQHQTPIRLDGDGAAIDDTVIEVVGLVVGVFSPR
jgi:SOS-response transcriptional repressor LexA